MSALTLNRIAPQVYWTPADSRTDRPILGVIAGPRGSLVVDTGNSPAHAAGLLQAMEEHRLPPPRFVALTHWHWDHVFGTDAFDVPGFAYQETRRIVTCMAGMDWSDAALDTRVASGEEIAFCRDMMRAELPDRAGLCIRPPEIGFATEVTVDLGGVHCQIIHVGGDHSPDSSVVYVPEARVMFLGDCIYHDMYHGPNRLTTVEILPLFERLLGYDAEYYLPSHHQQPLTRAELESEAALMTTIGSVVDWLGDDRAAVLAALPTALGALLEDDHIEIADAFLAGLRLPAPMLQ